MRKTYFTKSIQISLTILLSWALTLSGLTQTTTTLISPTVNNGSFESGLTNWTTAQSPSSTNGNKWVVGTVAGAQQGSNSVYISTGAAGLPNTYSFTTSRTSHLYTDITFPACETNYTFNFQWKGNGQSGNDRLLVYIAPTSVTPSSGNPTSPSTTLSGATLLWTQPNNSQATYTTASITLTAAQVGNTYANATRRIIFTWQNNNSTGSNPPTSVDNINLSSAANIAPECVASPTAPADLATNIPTTQVLSWPSVPYATGYDVYLGTSNPATTLVSSNQTGTTYTPASLSMSTTYYWRVVPRNCTGTATGCATWSFSTVVPPANDDCANATSISSLPYSSGTQSTVNSTDDLPASTTGCGGTSAKNVWYKVTGTGCTFTASTDATATNFDTEIHVYSGSCGSLTEVACNDDGGSIYNLASVISFATNLGTDYYISIGYYTTGTTTGNYELLLTAGAPLTPTVSISSSPSVIFCGSGPTSTTFTATATNGGTSPVYTWYLNGSQVQSGSSANYTLSSPVNGDQVYCVLTSNAGCITTTTATSGVMTITYLPTPPSNNNCNGAIALTMGSFTNGTTGCATASGQAVCSGTADDDVWYSFTATSAVHNISLNCQSGFNGVAQIYSGSCTGLTQLACMDNAGSGLNEYYSLSGLTIGNVYYVRVYSNGNGNSFQGNFSLKVEEGCPLLQSFTTSNDGPVCVGGTINLVNSDPAASFTFSNSTVTSIPDFSGGANGVVRSLIQATATGLAASAIANVTVNITHTYDGDLILYLYAPNGSRVTLSNRRGASGDNYTNTVFVTGGTAITSGTAPFTGNFAPETAFSTLTGNADGYWGLQAEDGAAADVGTIDSWSITFNNGTTISWSGPNSYSSTSNDPSITNIALAGSGNYTFTVTYPNACTRTSVTNVSVVADPSVATQPVASQTVCLNSSASVSVVGAGGTPSLTYQWYSNTINSNSGGTAISGATSASYSPSTGTAGTFYYYCVINAAGNGCNTATTNVSVLTVNPLPSLSGVTQAAAVCAGANATINLAGLIANSTSTITYNIGGGSDQTATVTADASGAGSFNFTSSAVNNGQVLTVTAITRTDLTPNCSNTFSSSNSVTLTINFAPVATCPADINVNNDNGSCGALVTFSATSTGQPAAAISYTQNPGTLFNIGTTTVTATAVNSCGSSVCNFNVTVTDTELPVLSGISNVAADADGGACAATSVDLGTPLSSDNCGVFNVTNDGPASYPVGTTTVTWTVTDINGNSNTYSQQVIISDSELPVISGLNDITVPADAGSCFATGVNLGTPVTSDNCGVASTTNNAPASYPVGVTTVTWTVTDVNGNITTFEQYVTVTGSGSNFWSGAVNDDWFNAGNWCNGVVPTSTTNVEVPSSAPNMPNIGAAGAQVKNISINSGGSLTMSNGGSLSIYGNLAENGTFNPGDGTITFAGSSAQTITGVLTFYNLSLNNSAGLILNTFSNITVNNNLNLANGQLITYENKVTIANGGIVTRTNGFVNGNLNKYAVTGSNVAISYEIGSQTYYVPVTLTFATVSTAGYVSVNTLGADHPEINTSGLTTTKTVNRHWNMVNTGVVFDQYTAALKYVTSDIDPGFNAANSQNMQYANGAWSFLPNYTNSSLTQTITGITDIGGLQIGYKTMPTAKFVATSTSITCSTDGSVKFGNMSTGYITGYQWDFGAGASPATATGPGPFTVTYSTTGLKTISLTALSPLGNDTYTKNNYINVTNSAPINPGVITGPITICSTSGSYNYSINAIPGATSYTWSVPAGTTFSQSAAGNSITLNVSAGFAAGTVSVIANNACGASAVRTLMIQKVPYRPGAITGSTVLCGTGSATYSIAALATATSYTWTVPASIGTITSGQGTNSIDISFAVGTFTTGNISVVANNACGSSGAMALSISIYPPVPGTISGPQSLCGTGSAAYSIAAMPSATSYTWTVPASVGTITSGQGTNSITINFSGGSFVTDAISVVANNACGSGPAKYQTITINPLLPGVISGPASVCGLTNGTYTIANVSGATSYNWTVPASVGTITSGQGTTSITVNYSGSFVGDNISVTGSNTCGTGSPRNLAVNLSPVMPASITGTNLACGVQTAIYSCPVAQGADSYTWTVPASLGTIASGQGTKTIVVNLEVSPVSGNVLVVANNACGTSAAKATRVLGCTEGSRLANKDAIEIAGEAEMLKLNLYPNPSNGNFNIDLYSNVDKKVWIEIYDALGQLVVAQRRTVKEGIQNTLNIDFAGHDQGIYFVKVIDTDTGYIKTQRLVVEK